METGQFSFIYKHDENEENLFSGGDSLISISEKSKIYKHLLNDKKSHLFFTNNKGSISLDICHFVNVNVNGVGTFHFAFDNDVKFKEIEEKIITLKKIDNNENEQIEKINNLFNIIDKYKPLFGYILFAYSNINSLNISAISFPFLYLKQKEKGPVAKFIFNPLIYVNLLCSLLAVNSTGFIIKSIAGKNFLFILFVFIVLACLILFVFLDYLRYKESTDFKLLNINDVPYFLVSLFGMAIGGGILYCLLTFAFDKSDLHTNINYIIISICVSIALVVVGKVLAYIIFRKTQKKNL